MEFDETKNHENISVDELFRGEEVTFVYFIENIDHNKMQSDCV